ncbi:glycoside hydrolase family 3 protein [Arthrobacter mobilis]|uniref:glycoside hydrolase family 3 protein n=1 Tax=Arthrobacter mobilis TaxID=2724944 RepID=UPI0028A8ABDF|nr:glycoside hydrolase family 3 N-terminal domain-containing protein [Arthrobacter mobilis]
MSFSGPRPWRAALSVLAASAALLLSSCTPAPQAPAPGAAAPSPSAAQAQEQALSWGPSRQHFDDAAAAVADMSLAQKAGQVMVAFYAGTDPAPQLQAIEELHLGGSIIMGDNVPKSADGTVDVEAMKSVNESLQRALSAGRSWPGIISVDQEGGLVARLGAPLTEWPAPMTYGAAGSAEVSRESMRALATELAALGFTMDHAPTADLTIGEQDPTIGARSLGSSPSAGAQLAPLLAGFEAAGVMPSVKHFPGHGSVTTDSHLALPVQKASLARLKKRDWVPFRDAIAAGAPVVMMGHIAVEALDPGMPSSLSAASYRQLRGLGFEGVAVTDALNMGAIESTYPGGQAAPMALRAGADLLLMPADPYAAHAAVVAAVKDGSLPEERLDEAATRVVALQLWQASLAGGVSLDEVGAHQEESKAASAAALTVLTGQCSGDQLDGALTIQGTDPRHVQRLTEAARARGLQLGGGPVVTLLDGAATAAGDTAADIAVALDGPWALADADAGLKAALYGDTPAAFEALLDYLTGQAPAPGKLPATVGDYSIGTGCSTGNRPE